MQLQWVIERMVCGRVGWIQDDAEVGKQAGKSLVNMLTPLTFERALMVPSWMASMVAPMASMVASMASMVASMASMVAPMATMASMVAPLASMVELDWWKQLIKRFVYERADGLTHKIREELTVGWTLIVDMIKAVTWARTKRRASLVDSTSALMTAIASMASMSTLVVTMMASMVS